MSKPRKPPAWAMKAADDAAEFVNTCERDGGASVFVARLKLASIIAQAHKDAGWEELQVAVEETLRYGLPTHDTYECTSEALLEFHQHQVKRRLLSALRKVSE